MTDPKEVIRVLRRAKVGFVLMGTHGISGYRSEPRATQDVDILVTRKDHKKAVRVVEESFPDLTVVEGRVVTSFKEPKTGKVVIDLMKPLQQVYKIAFRNSVRVGAGYRIPSLEMALVAKFAAMVSPHRPEEKKLVDGGDFVDMVKTNRDAIDRAKLTRLGNQAYPGGANEILEMIDRILAGKRIRF